MSGIKLKALKTTKIQVGSNAVEIVKDKIYELPLKYIEYYSSCFKELIETPAQRSKRLKQELVEAETNKVKAKTI